MLIEELNILVKHGKQFIPDLRKAVVPPPFRGRIKLSTEKISNEKEVVDFCPMKAISSTPLRVDLGKCNFCGECAIAYPNKFSFTNDHKLASNSRDALIIHEGTEDAIKVNPSLIRKEIQSIFGRSLKLRQVCAGGDNSCELELGACGNVNFDMARFGIEFVASPRHADGIVLTGPISENMANAFRIAYDAVPEPKLLILCGVDAISGGIFKNSDALNRGILNGIPVDLYVPGNPPHPLTFINGILDLTRKK